MRPPSSLNGCFTSKSNNVSSVYDNMVGGLGSDVVAVGSSALGLDLPLFFVRSMGLLT